MQCKNDIKELDSDIKLSKSVKNLAVTHETNTFDSQHNLQTESSVKDNYNLLHLDNNDMFSVRNSLTSNSINFTEPQLPKMHLESLSEGTRNFLNELAASNPANAFNDNISGYALSSINSPLLSVKGKKATECNFNDSCKSESVSTVEDNTLSNELGNKNKDVIATLCNFNDENKEDTSALCYLSDENKAVTSTLCSANVENKEVTDVLCNITDENKDMTSVLCSITDENKDVTSVLCNINDEIKDVTNAFHDISAANKDVTSTLCDIGDETKAVTSALDLIEQSSLHDRNLSSAEICNSLNQIFSETASDLSANAISTVDSSQTDGTEVDVETNSITLCMNNESEIYLQAVESGISLTADETGTINLSGNNSEFWQRVLLVQDETGKIETVYLLQDDKVEGLSADVNNIEGISSESNVENTETNECMVVDGTLDDSVANRLHNLFVSQDVVNSAENVLITQDTIGEQHLEPVLANTVTNANMLASQTNMDVNQDCVKVENISKGSNMLQLGTDDKEIILIEQEKGNINVNSNVEFSENNADKSETVSPEQSSDNLRHIQEILPNSAEKPADICIQRDYVNNTSLNDKSSETPINLNNSLVSNFNQTSKAKKSISRNVSDRSKSVENLIQFSQTLSNTIDVSNIYKTTTSHVNGAIYHSESNHTLPSNVQCYNSSGCFSKSNRLLKSELINNKSLQKSKKSVHQNFLGRSARKSLLGSRVNNCSSNYSDLNVLQTFDESNPAYVRMKHMVLKRTLEGEQVQDMKRTKSDCIGINEGTNSIFRHKSRTVALKTFKRPFTAAKKSVLDSREMLKNIRNTAMKTFVPKMHKAQSALKTFCRKQDPLKSNQTIYIDNNMLSRNVPEKNVNIEQSYRHQTDPQAKVLFQPEICEIRILPNELASTPEDNASDEEIKLPSGCISPVKEFLSLKFHCSCAAKEVPCICNDGNLQLTCEAEDSVDGNIVSCINSVSQQYLLTPSHEIKHRAFCDIHQWRLHEHHCCPKCGVFCSQGEFLLCSYEDAEKEENHLFHTSCSIVVAPGLPPSCPHCCKFSNFNPVHLIYRSAHLEQNEVPSNAQNITSELNGCDIFLIPKQYSEQQVKQDSSVFVPDKKDLQVMITSLANEKSLRLRPTGKCLYNPIKIGDTQKVMQLIANGVNPNHKFRTHSNNAPIHVAVYYGWTGILHVLLQAGAFIDSVNDDLETPLIVAVERNHLPIVRYLVLAGAQIDVKDCNGMTSFHIASKNGFKEIAEYLYSTGTIDINLQDDGGWTALVWACEHKHVDFVKWLLSIGADPNVRDNEENTVLHWAAYSGKSEIAELLLNKGCTLSYVNKRGDSALHIAAREDNYECVKLFINRGAVVDQKNKENKTPLMCCQDDSLSFNYLCQSISSGALKIGKMQLEKHVVFRDISRGAEAYPIQAINEVDDEEFIMEFRYVVKNCHRSGANINIINTVDSMQFCYCKDNCVTRDCNCMTSSKCWYDANGCLTSEYNLQHAPVIFECNKTCHCPKTCINRVVQQGLRCPLQLFRTRYKGWGVRTLQVIPKGAFVCEYVGELISGREATQRDDDTYFFDLESKESDYCLDGRYYGNVARFLNHSCDPNLMAVKVFVDHQDLNFPRIAFFAVRRIHAFEELCFDYGLDFWIVKCQTILCTCNSQLCKYSKDAIDDTLIKFFKDTRCGAQLEAES